MPRGLPNGWHSLLPAQAGPGKPLSAGLGRGSPPWPPPLAACGRDTALARAESTVSGESVYFDAGALNMPQKPVALPRPCQGPTRAWHTGRDMPLAKTAPMVSERVWLRGTSPPLPKLPTQ